MVTHRGEVNGELLVKGGRLGLHRETDSAHLGGSSDIVDTVNLTVD